MIFWLVLGFIAAIFVLHYQHRRTLPPGPVSLPIVGCMPFIGKSITAVLKVRILNRLVANLFQT